MNIVLSQAATPKWTAVQSEQLECGWFEEMCYKNKIQCGSKTQYNEKYVRYFNNNCIDSLFNLEDFRYVNLNILVLFLFFEFLCFACA